MRGLTPTDCLRYINRNLGAAMQVIELNEDEIMRIVFQETIPTFSKYFPWHPKALIKCNRDRLPNSRNSFFINDPEYEKIEITGIHKIWVDNVAYYGHSQIAINTDPFNQQLMMDTISAVTTPITFNFQAPNILQIFPYVTGLQDILVELSAIHPTHLKTIPQGYREWFLKLAYLDVLVSLLPLRKRFENISSPYGQIQLFLDAVDRSVDERQSLLEKFEENFLKDSNTKRIWIS